MFRNLGDCLETLEDAGARFYTITGAGTNLSFAPDDENGATVEAALLRFEKDFQKLGPGRYTVTHKKNSAANRNPASFSFFRAAEGAVSGIGADPAGSQIAALQMEMQQMRNEIALNDIKRGYEEQIKALKQKADQPDGTDKLINAVGQINQLFQNSKTLPAPAVAGTSSAPAVAGASDEQSAIVQETVEAIHAALGGTEAETFTFLKQIGEKARTQPAVINQLKMML
ncbi:hypothetical protein Q5H93_02970 [Hymenobacter sp. ASUV-10]|uniref:Uncharacterized protein n=1 Tax=Hymenobacter aranciens TaxID=3063996 RepID=A0ABT9B5X9_9BACT|nr:hypothetical protein [Hymenobacter sp. ASUV-10]MDO7873681.1 hypothetical protein [Hymenobacter sp. ASUV-10]